MSHHRKDAQNFVKENMGTFVQDSSPQKLESKDICLRVLTQTHSGESVITKFDKAQWREVMIQRWLDKVPGEVVVFHSKVRIDKCAFLRVA